MKRISISACIVSCALFAFQSGYAQANKKFVMMPHHDPSTPQGMEGGMWRTDANFESILHLKNILINHPLTATPILYMEDGTAYQLPPVTLEPAGVASVNIDTALNDMPPAIAAHRSLYGIVGVKYNWSWPAMIATVRNIDEAEMVSLYGGLHADVNDSHSSSAAQKMQHIEGMWWKPYKTTDGFIFLSNTLLKPLQATVASYDSSGISLGSKTVNLASHQSAKLLLSDLVGAQPTGATGSLIITYTGSNYGLSAVGGLEDDTNGYSATLDLQEMHPERGRNSSVHQVVLDAPGILFGQQEPQMQFPQNTVFTPYGYLHNTSAQSRQVTITASVAGHGYPITSLTLAPHATEEIDYKDALKSLKLPPTTTIDISASYTGNDGDTLMEEGSVDQTGNYVFEVEPQAEGWTISRTICDWELHDETDSMISLWNYSPNPEDLKLTLYYAGGQYVIPIHLAPQQDYELDLATLVHSALPDANGSIIPQSITEGSATLADAHDPRNHILMASASAVFNVRTATCSPTCQECDGVSEIDILPGTVYVMLSGTAQDQAEMKYNNGWIYYVTSGSWSTSNGAISTVNVSGLVKGVGVGSDNIYDEFTNIPSPAGYICLIGNCPVYNGGGSGGANVVNLSCTSVTRGQSTTCTATGPSGSSFSGWQFKDSAGNTIASSSTSSTWSGTAVQSGTVFVDVNGQQISASLTVNPRTNFAFVPVNPVQQSEGYVCNQQSMSVPNPPNGSGTGDKIGLSCLVETGGYQATSVGGDGPNTGYWYITSASNQEQYNWIMAPDAQNSQSSFYQAQCGNWNGTTGYISGLNLQNDTIRHESGSTESHYINYKTAEQQSANNLGIGFESTVAYEPSDFSSYVSSHISSRAQTVVTAFQVEPCGTSAVNYNAVCSYDGPANFGGIAVCSQ